MYTQLIHTANNIYTNNTYSYISIYIYIYTQIIYIYIYIYSGPRKLTSGSATPERLEPKWSRNDMAGYVYIYIYIYMYTHTYI